MQKRFWVIRDLWEGRESYIRIFLDPPKWNKRWKEWLGPHGFDVEVCATEFELVFGPVPDSNVCYEFFFPEFEVTEWKGVD